MDSCPGESRDRAPTAFLYAIGKSRMTHRSFVCDLVELGLNHSISRWSGDMGINWECATFTMLVDNEDGTRRELIIVSGERAKTWRPDLLSTQHLQQQTRCPRAQNSQQ